MKRKREGGCNGKGRNFQYQESVEVDYGKLCSKDHQIKEAVENIKRLNIFANSPKGAFLAVFVWAFIDDLLTTFIFPRNIIESPDDHPYLENVWFHRLKSLFIFFVSAYFITQWLAKRETNNV